MINNNLIKLNQINYDYCDVCDNETRINKYKQCSKCYNNDLIFNFLKNK